MRSFAQGYFYTARTISIAFWPSLHVKHFVTLGGYTVLLMSGTGNFADKPQIRKILLDAVLVPKYGTRLPGLAIATLGH